MDCGVGIKVMSSKFITTYPWNGGKVYFKFFFEFVVAFFVWWGVFFFL